MDDDKVTNRAAEWAKFLKDKYKRQLAEISREYPFRRSLYIDIREVENYGKLGIDLADDVVNNPGKTRDDIHDSIATHQLIKCGLKNEEPKDLNIRFSGFYRRTKLRLS